MPEDADETTETFRPADEILRQYCLRVYNACGQNKTEAARILELSRVTFYRHLKRWSVE